MNRVTNPFKRGFWTKENQKLANAETKTALKEIKTGYKETLVPEFKEGMSEVRKDMKETAAFTKETSKEVGSELRLIAAESKAAFAEGWREAEERQKNSKWHKFYKMCVKITFMVTIPILLTVFLGIFGLFLGIISFTACYFLTKKSNNEHK